MQGGERYNSISDELKRQFGRKTIKLGIDAGFTCPNRDGTCGVGGCAFCSGDGSGELASHLSALTLLTQPGTTNAANTVNNTDAVNAGDTANNDNAGDTANNDNAGDTANNDNADYTSNVTNASNTLNAEDTGISDNNDNSAISANIDTAAEIISGKISESISEQIALMSEKWPDAAYLAYFQSHTNTYAPVAVLRTLYNAALDDPRISGIVIATRPDCLPPDVLDLLEEINRTHYMWVELGLQTIHQETSEAMGIGYTLETYDKAVDELLSRGIRVVSHLILGLPGETEDMMLQSVRHVCSKPIFGIKLHLMNIVKTSRLGATMPDYVPFSSIDEYVDLVIRCLEIIPPEITIHRLTGDVPRRLLISPEWSYRKRTILNTINSELARRGTYQGKSV